LVLGQVRYQKETAVGAFRIRVDDRITYQSLTLVRSKLYPGRQDSRDVAWARLCNDCVYEDNTPFHVDFVANMNERIHGTVDNAGGGASNNFFNGASNTNPIYQITNCLVI
jgi:hypothetical protein